MDEITAGAGITKRAPISISAARTHSARLVLTVDRVDHPTIDHRERLWDRARKIAVDPFSDFVPKNYALCGNCLELLLIFFNANHRLFISKRRSVWVCGACNSLPTPSQNRYDSIVKRWNHVIDGIQVETPVVVLS
jgi:hypothetical protein